jgi:hypothetical protein
MWEKVGGWAEDPSPEGRLRKRMEHVWWEAVEDPKHTGPDGGGNGEMCAFRNEEGDSFFLNSFILAWKIFAFKDAEGNWRGESRAIWSEKTDVHGLVIGYFMAKRPCNSATGHISLNRLATPWPKAVHSCFRFVRCRWMAQVYLQ